MKIISLLLAIVLFFITRAMAQEICPEQLGQKLCHNFYINQTVSIPTRK